MTNFEELAVQMGLPIETDKNGQYTGKTATLYGLVCALIIDGDHSDEEILRIAEGKFYQIFPYMLKKA